MGEDKPKTRAKAKTPPPPERKAVGFLRAAELTPGALKTAGAKRGFAEHRVLTQWQAVVGDALAALCRPVKVTYKGRGAGLGATLVVTSEGARAPEVDMRRAEILEKVNAFCGYRMVSRLSIDQSRMASGFAEPAPEWIGAPVQSAPVPDVADERLALALGRLGANIRTKAAKAAPDDKSRS